MGYIEEYEKLKADKNRAVLFSSTSEQKARRIFKILNANIKTLKTVGEYIKDMYDKTSSNCDTKQKNERIRVFNFRSTENHSDARAITRSDIVMATANEFGGYDHAFSALIIYILLLDTGSDYNIVVSEAKMFIDSLPIFIKRRLFEYAKEIASSKSFLVDNIYQQIVVLYGDRDLYDAFLSFISEKYPNEDEIKDLFESESKNSQSPIYERIYNYQASSLKKEALYTIIFYSLDQYVRECKLNGLRTGKTIIGGVQFLNGFLEYFGNISDFDESISWLGKIKSGEDIHDLQSFIKNKLSEDQRNEICTCIMKAFELEVPQEEE